MPIPDTAPPHDDLDPALPMAPDLKEVLQSELSKMHKNKERFMKNYRLLDEKERRDGGQGLVQFMSMTRRGAEPVTVAVKFFLARGAYAAEMNLYNEGGLRSMLPEKVAEMPAGVARSVRGFEFPPCIVLKKGQSLKDWSEIVRQPKVATVFDVCTPSLDSLRACVSSDASSAHCLFIIDVQNRFCLSPQSKYFRGYLQNHYCVRYVTPASLQCSDSVLTVLCKYGVHVWSPCAEIGCL